MIDSVLARRKMRQLVAAMAEEREILLRGPLEKLQDMSSRRDQILQSLIEGGAVSRQILTGGLEEIKATAARNAVLMQASMSGIKDARKEIENMEEKLNQLDTYARDGARMKVAQTLPGKGHRI